MPETITVDCGGGRDIKLVLIPAGEFVMGMGVDDVDRAANETPPTSVNISRPFYLGIYEVTNAQYAEF